MKLHRQTEVNHSIKTLEPHKRFEHSEAGRQQPLAGVG
jgi:hypothetical protein